MAIKAVSKKRYHVYLDYKPYMIDPRSFNEREAPLFGNKFSSGEPSYSSLDFWQRTGNTDWQRGHGQKFHVDPAKFQESYGLELQNEAGQITLARSPEDLGAALGHEISSYYVDQEPGEEPVLYLGTTDGRIYSGTLPLTEMPTRLITTGTNKEVTEIFRIGLYVYALIPGDFAIRRDADGSGWQTTDIVNWNKATVWGDYVYGSFDDAGEGSYREVKFCAHPGAILTQADWDAATTAFTLPTRDVKINKLLFAHERLYIGTNARLLGWDGGGDPWQLYDFTFAIDDNNFKDMVLADNYVWFPIHKVGIFYTNGANVAYTTISEDNEFLKFHRALTVGQNGPTVWATFFSKDESGDGTGSENLLTDNSKSWTVDEWIDYYLWDSENTRFKITDNDASTLIVDGTPASGDYVIGKYWLCKSKTRNYFFKYLEAKNNCLLPSYSNDLYLTYKDGDVHKLNRDCDYQTNGRLISSQFDANLICLEKLIKNVICYHKPLITGESVKVAANFDDEYDLSEFSSWASVLHEYAAGGPPGFEIAFTGDKETGKQSYKGGKLAQRFQYGIELNGDGSTTPSIQDIFWTYYLETPYGENARKLEWQMAILASDRLEKLDEETIESYEQSTKSGKTIVDNLRTTRQKKGVLNFVAPNHVLTPVFRLVYHGASATALLTIDQVNGRLGITTTVSGDNVNISLEAATYDTIGEVVAYLNGLTNYVCTIADEASSDGDSSELLPLYEVSVKGSATDSGKLFYSATDQHKVIMTSFRKRNIRVKAEDEKELAHVYLSLREI